MLKKVCFLFIFGLSSFLATAQFSNTYSQWWMHQPIYNPAASGLFTDFEAGTGVSFYQLKGLGEFDYEGPAAFARADMYAEKLHGGIGINWLNNNLDNFWSETDKHFSQQRLAINYNYQFNLKNKATLATGLSAELVQNSWFFGGTSNNPASPPDPGKETFGRMGFGVIYKAADWYMGVSLPSSVNLTAVDYFGGFGLTGTHLSAGAEVLVGKHQKFMLAPDLLVRTNFFDYVWLSPVLRLEYAEAVFVAFGVSAYYGSTTMSFDNVNVTAGIRLAKTLQAAYTYTYNISDFSNLDFDIHSISLIFSPSKTSR